DDHSHHYVNYDYHSHHYYDDHSHTTDYHSTTTSTTTTTPSTTSTMTTTPTTTTTTTPTTTTTTTPTTTSTTTTTPTTTTTTTPTTTSTTTTTPTTTTTTTPSTTSTTTTTSPTTTTTTSTTTSSTTTTSTTASTTTTATSNPPSGGDSICAEVILTHAQPLKTVMSPNYPDYYPDNYHCEFNITAPLGRKVDIYFDVFKVEYSSKCVKDYFQIVGIEKYYGIKICGHKIPKLKLLSKKNYLTVTYHSDGGGKKLKGFKIFATAVKDTSA
ncbi:cell wall protein DAN4-like, partial [Homarus americanus]|uniref:cell wall protein DAN4-like n=1 Tax=Homarus americanus TaxID=6706 RepID=UPI001C44E0F6